MSEYLSRREFNKRFFLASVAVAADYSDIAYMSHKNGEAKKEITERGITPPTQANKTLQTKEEKCQQKRFDNAVDKRFHEKISLYGLRVGVDSTAVGGGFVALFNTLLRKSPYPDDSE